VIAVWRKGVEAVVVLEPGRSLPVGEGELPRGMTCHAIVGVRRRRCRHSSLRAMTSPAPPDGGAILPLHLRAAAQGCPRVKGPFA
jgi:hypothetical protein